MFTIFNIFQGDNDCSAEEELLFLEHVHEQKLLLGMSILTQHKEFTVAYSYIFVTAKTNMPYTHVMCLICGYVWSYTYNTTDYKWLTEFYGTKSPMTRHFRILCQSFVLTPGMKVAVDPSVEQPTTIFICVIKPTKHMYKIWSSHVINYQHCFCYHHRGSFTRVRRIQLSATLNIGNHSIL